MCIRDRSQDKATAAEFYAKAADQGDQDAMFKLGCWHRDGEAGFVPDIKKAREYLQRAREAGHNLAAAELEKLEVGEAAEQEKTVRQQAPQPPQPQPPQKKRSLLHRLFGRGEK